MNAHHAAGLVAALFAALGQTTTLAQDALPIERPTIKLGDSWTTRSLDGWNNSETSQTTFTVAGIEEGRIILRSQSMPTGETQTLTYTPDWQVCRSMQNSTELVCDGVFKFPLTASYRHTINKLPSSSGATFYDAECEGKGMEKVRVPAGEFDAFKVECKGRWTQVFGGARSGQYDDTSWYAPSVRNRVKQVFNTRRSNGTPSAKLVVEMTEFKPAP